MTFRNTSSYRMAATSAEQAMWRMLRNRQLVQAKFRRQHPIGRYVVDFVSLSRRLVIEIDGGQHSAQAARDEKRTRFLQSRNYDVIRFWNNEVLCNPEGVFHVLLERLRRRS